MAPSAHCYGAYLHITMGGVQAAITTIHTISLHQVRLLVVHGGMSMMQRVDVTTATRGTRVVVLVVAQWDLTAYESAKGRADVARLRLTLGFSLRSFLLLLHFDLDLFAFFKA